MEKSTRLVNMSLAATVLILIGIVLAFTALTDIAHQREPNLDSDFRTL